MMYIAWKDGTYTEKHVGSPISCSPSITERIDYIQVDGHELELALEITGLPSIPLIRVQSIPMPWAELVLRNWR